MFQFARFPLANAGAQILPERVTPFGNPQLSLLDSSLRLFAVLSRPSSAVDAKASTLCSFFLDLRQDEHKTYSVFKVQTRIIQTQHYTTPLLWCQISKLFLFW